MYDSTEDLFDIVDRMRDLPVLVVGDIMLDHYIWGGVERISPEAPVPVVHVSEMEPRLGGAGNVVRNLLNLGAKVTLCGFIGDDQEGKTVLKLLDESNIDKNGIIVERERPTTLKIRVVAHAQYHQSQQIVRIDREKREAPQRALLEGLAAVVDSYIDSHAAIVLSDYAKGAIGETLFKKLRDARAVGRIGLGKCPVILDPHPKNFEAYQQISIFKPNRREAEQASGVKITDRDSALEAALVLLDKFSCEMVLITLGEDGLMLVDSESKQPTYFDTIALDVYDVSGAGDTVTAILTAALAAGAAPATAADLANVGGGIVVAEVGTAAIQVDKLKDEIQLLSDLKQCLASK